MSAKLRLTILISPETLSEIKSALHVDEGETFPQFVRRAIAVELKLRARNVRSSSEETAAPEPEHVRPSLPHRRDLTLEERAQIPGFLLNR